MGERKQTRREFLKAAGVSAAAITLGGCFEGVPKPSSDRPNIVFIFSDDHACRAISAYGSGINHTPNIDRIADEGVMFTNSFCGNSICGPSRASILTGKHSHTTGYTGNGSIWKNDQFLFPRLMKQNGYRTALIGKWHLNGSPGDQFDYWKILSNNGGQGRYYNPEFIDSDGEDSLRTGYSTDVITEDSLKWVDKNKDQPFLMMIHYKATHVHQTPAVRHANLYDGEEIPEPVTLVDDFVGRPKQKGVLAPIHLVPPLLSNIFPPDGEYDLDDPQYTVLKEMTPAQRKGFEAAHDPENREYYKLLEEGKFEDLEFKRKYTYQRFVKNYLRVVAAIDENVGKVRKYLDDNGLTDNTIFIYASDQGYFLGEHGGRVDKRMISEESLKMPFFIQWPGKVKSGLRPMEMVQNIDYAPTLLDMAGIDVPDEIQGRSFKPLLEGKKVDDWRKSIYYHYYDHGNFNVPRHEGVRTERYKLVNFYTDGFKELYDLKNDPYEVKNLIDDPEHADLLNAMRNELQKLRDQYKVPEEAFIEPYLQTPSIINTIIRPRKAAPISQMKSGNISLDGSKCAIVGDNLRVISMSGVSPILCYWVNPEDFASWKINVKKAGKFALTLAYATSGETKLEAIVNGQRMLLDLPSTGGYGSYVKFTSKKSFDLKPGSYTITLKPVAENWTTANINRIYMICK